MYNQKKASKALLAHSPNCSVLLGSAGTCQHSVPTSTSKGRAGGRQEASTFNSSSTLFPPLDTVPSSKSTTTAAHGTGESTGSSKLKPDNCSGGAVGKVKKRNRTFGRRTELMAVDWTSSNSVPWPNPACPTSPSHSHHLVSINFIDGGSIFRCQYCSCYVWLPNSIDELIHLSIIQDKFGVQSGYNRILQLHPAVPPMLIKLTGVSLNPPSGD